ncbi:MAG: hypothetical protein ACPL6F_02355, partial [Anaerolineales bacterium]
MKNALLPPYHKYFHLLTQTNWISGLLIFLLLILLFIFIFLSRPAQAAFVWQTKVDPWVLSNAQSGAVDFLVVLDQQADLSAAATLQSKLEKGFYVYQQLTQTAQRTQPALLLTLRKGGWKYQTFWVANMILVHGDATALQVLASRADVRHIYANPTVKLDLPQIESGAGLLATDNIEWNISKV